MKLYENQVKLAAPAQPRAQAAQMSNAVAVGLQQLSRDTQAYSDYVVDIEDNKLRMDMQLIRDDELSKLKNGNFETENDIAKARMNAFDAYSNTFQSNEENVMNRYKRDNPNHFEAYNLALNDISVKKMGELQAQRTERELPTYVAEAVLGKIPLEQVDMYIDKNNFLSPEAKKSLKQDSVRTYDYMQVLNSINDERFDYAKKLLENGGEHTALTTEQLSSLTQRFEAVKQESINRATAIRTGKDETMQNVIVAQAWEAKMLDQQDGGNRVQQIINDLENKRGDYANMPAIQVGQALQKIKSGPGGYKTSKDLLYAAQADTDYNELIEVQKYTDGILKAGNKTEQMSNSAALSRAAQEFINADGGAKFRALSEKEQGNVYAMADEYNRQVLAEAMPTADFNALIVNRKNSEAMTQMGELAGIQNMSDEDRVRMTKALMSGGQTDNAILMARKNLDENVLIGDMKQSEGTQSRAITNTYLMILSNMDNPQKLSELGLDGISRKSLTQAYTTMLTDMKNDRTYSQPSFASNDKYAANAFKTNFDKFVEYASMGVPATKEQIERRNNLYRSAVSGKSMSDSRDDYMSEASRNIIFPRRSVQKYNIEN